MNFGVFWIVVLWTIVTPSFEYCFLTLMYVCIYMRKCFFMFTLLWKEKIGVSFSKLMLLISFRQLFRSVGCVSHEIRVDCTNDINATVVIENATFYSVPDENWLNCSRGPLGPLPMGGLATSTSEATEIGSLGRHQHSIFAGVSGFSSLTNVR